MIRTDEEIKRDVVDHLYWDHSVDAAEVKVEVAEGEVTLTGTVDNYAAGSAAVADARSVNGVNGVKDLLAVSFPPTYTVPMDDEIQSNAKNALAWNPAVYSFDIDVSVANGIVQLEGTVDAYWKRYTAENVVSGLRGVIDVVNKLAVVPTEEVTDRLIAEDIEAALDRNVYVNTEEVTVKVENGIVTLTGSVPTWHSGETAHDVAAYTLGVKDVQNYLTIG
jgi:hyperosmotically inducible protein